MKAEHVHGCRKCQPERYPQVSMDDPRYHVAEKCGWHADVVEHVDLDGARVYVYAAYEGEDGWVLFCGPCSDLTQIHTCPCGSKDACTQLVHGYVTTEHEVKAVA